MKEVKSQILRLTGNLWLNMALESPHLWEPSGPVVGCWLFSHLVWELPLNEPLQKRRWREVPAPKTNQMSLNSSLGAQYRPCKGESNPVSHWLSFPKSFAFHFPRTVNSGYFLCSQGPWVDNKAWFQSRHRPRNHGIECAESRQMIFIYTSKFEEKMYFFRFQTL